MSDSFLAAIQANRDAICGVDAQKHELDERKEKYEDNIRTLRADFAKGINLADYNWKIGSNICGVFNTATVDDETWITLKADKPLPDSIRGTATKINDSVELRGFCRELALYGQLKHIVDLIKEKNLNVDWSEPLQRIDGLIRDLNESRNKLAYYKFYSEKRLGQEVWERQWEQWSDKVKEQA